MEASHSTPVVRALQVPTDRRTALGALMLAGLLGGLSPVRIGAQEATPATGGDPVATPTPFTDQVFTGQGFVGEVTDVPTGQAFVAVVIAGPQSGQERREVRALLYGDPENLMQEWFPGAVTGDRLDLVADSGARLTSDLSTEGALGTVTLADDTDLTFAAMAATGVAGLYSVQLFPDGHLEGTSERGVRLEGQLGAETDEPDVYALAGTLTPPDAGSQDFSALFLVPETIHEVVNLRFIVLPDGRMRGGARKQEEQKVTIPILA
jgi:hypothetical protein